MQEGGHQPRVPSLRAQIEGWQPRLTQSRTDASRIKLGRTLGQKRGGDSDAHIAGCSRIMALRGDRLFLGEALGDADFMFKFRSQQ